MKFREFAESWLKRNRRGLAHRTIETYQSRINTLCLSLGDTALSVIKPMTLQEVAAEMELSPNRIRDLMATACTIMNDARANGYNEFEFRFKPARKKKEKISPMSLEQVQIVISFMEKQYQPIFTFLSLTGCRPNEAIALKWSSLDFIANEALISEGMVRGREGDTKNHKSRKVPLDRDVIKLLQQLSTRPARWTSDFVFLNDKGKPFAFNLDRVWRRALAASGLEPEMRKNKIDCKSYDIRHAFASEAIYNGVSAPYLSKILGHSNVRMTFDFYTGEIQAHNDEQRRLLERALRGRKAS